jgi:hypothetical protein
MSARRFHRPILRLGILFRFPSREDGFSFRFLSWAPELLFIGRVRAGLSKLSCDCLTVDADWSQNIYRPRRQQSHGGK